MAVKPLSVALAGSTRAGKTVYLAALMRAAFAGGGQRARLIKVRPGLGDDGARQLSQAAVRMLCGEMPVGTSALQRHNLIVDLPGSRLGNIGRASVHLSVADPPGGDCLVAPGCPPHPEVLGRAVAADGLMLMLSCDPADRHPDMEARLSSFIRCVGQSKKRGRDKCLFERIAVVLTKCELLVLDQGEGAVQGLERMQARDVLQDLYGAAVVNLIGDAVPPGADWYSLVSVFGFDPVTGRSAVRRARQGWVYDGPVRDGVAEDWQPYRVYEPLEFLARGVCWQEALV